MWKFTACVVLLLGLSAHNGHALECWSCSSDVDQGCDEPFNATGTYFGGGSYQASYQSGYNQQPYDPYNQRPYDSRDTDYRNRDYDSRNPNYRDPYFDRDRTRDPYNNRDYNNRDRDPNYRDPNYRDPNYRDPNYRDGSRDPNFDRDHRGPYNRDPYNRDNPPRDYSRDYNPQGRSYDPNNPPRDISYQRAQAQFASSHSGPRLTICNEQDARDRGMKNVCLKQVRKYGEYRRTYIRRCDTIPLDKDVGTCFNTERGNSLEVCEYCDYDKCNSATGLKFNVFLASLIPLVLIWSILH